MAGRSSASSSSQNRPGGGPTAGCSTRCFEDEHGIRLVFVENEFGQGAAGALSFNVMAAVAQYYSNNLRSEVIKGIDEKVRQGWPTGLAPYGYLNVSDKNEPIIPHPERSKTLVRLFQLYASGQFTFQSLADKLAAEGHIYGRSSPDHRPGDVRRLPGHPAGSEPAHQQTDSGVRRRTAAL